MGNGDLHVDGFGIMEFGCLRVPGCTFRDRGDSIKINNRSLMARLRLASILTTHNLASFPFGSPNAQGLESDCVGLCSFTTYCGWCSSFQQGDRRLGFGGRGGLEWWSETRGIRKCIPRAQVVKNIEHRVA